MRECKELEKGRQGEALLQHEIDKKREKNDQENSTILLQTFNLDSQI